MTENRAIVINNLTGGYGKKTVLKDFSMEISKGSFNAIAGPNGSGKTTLLKFLIKQLKTEENKIFINGKDINLYKYKELAKQISFVNQNNNNECDLSVWQMVELGRFCHDDHDKNKIEKALKTVGLEYCKDSNFSELSGGEQQLVMLARAICQESAIMILDEPVNNLDPKHQVQLLKLLRDLSDNGKTIICILHDLNAILTWCDNCILLKEGRSFTKGTPEKVLSKENIKTVYDIDSSSFNQADGRLQLTFYCNR